MRSLDGTQRLDELPVVVQERAIVQQAIRHCTPDSSEAWGETIVRGSFDGVSQQSSRLFVIDCARDQWLRRASDLDGTTVCAGSGPGTVMLVSGQGTPMTTWEPVQEALASLARVCAYDRLGIGASDPLRGVQTLADMAVDLEGVMTELELNRPITLVGHSLGGAVAMTWAANNPQDVHGVVLVDSASSRFVERAMQLGAGSDEPLSSPVYAEDLQEATDAVLGNPERLDERSWLAFAELPDLEGVPLIVLARGRAEALIGYPEATWPELESAWQEGQREFLSRSSNSHLFEVDEAGHFIQDDRPEVVIASVLALYE